VCVALLFSILVNVLKVTKSEAGLKKKATTTKKKATPPRDFGLSLCRPFLSTRFKLKMETLVVKVREEKVLERVPLRDTLGRVFSLPQGFEVFSWKYNHNEKTTP